MRIRYRRTCKPHDDMRITSSVNDLVKRMGFTSNCYKRGEALVSERDFQKRTENEQSAEYGMVH